MPRSAPTPCRHTGCGALVSSPGYCELHKKQVQAAQDQRRGTSSERGYGYKWQQASAGFLKRHPLCECNECMAGQLRVRAATVVDHIEPHRLKQAMDSGNQAAIAKAKELFWCHSNWQAMAKECHDKKTAREDGGFGRPGAGQKSGAFSF